MKRQTLIGLGVAIILGVLAVFLANAYLSGRERQLANSPEGSVKVAVAAMPLAYGTEITPDKVKFVAYPATSLPPGIYRTMPELLPEGKSRVALRPILVNQPLLAADLSGSGQGASIAALLPDGMRAASVKINAISGVAGFIKPNDTVDVLITRQPLIGQSGEGGTQVTDVLLQNVRIIAMDQATGSDGKPKVSRVATLEVSPLDAQKLALGQQAGDLSLVLRKPGAEQNIPKVDTISLNDLRYSYYSSLPQAAGAAGAVPPAAAPVSAADQQARIQRLSRPYRPAAAPAPRPRPVAPPPPPKTVDVTRGTQTSTYEVGGNAR